jgi:hypothetical protein
LNAIVRQDVYNYVREDDKIHLSDEAINLCAKKVAAAIMKSEQV